MSDQEQNVDADSRRRKGKKVVIDDRPLWRKKRFLIPVSLIAIFVIGSALSNGGGSSSPGGNAKSSSASSGGVSSSESSESKSRKSITYDEIVAKSASQTDAQWEAFADELKSDYRADNWSGYVFDVREQITGNDYYVEIMTSPGDIIAPIHKDLTADDALSLSKDDSITVSGDIKLAWRAVDIVYIELAK